MNTAQHDRRPVGNLTRRQLLTGGLAIGSALGFGVSLGHGSETGAKIEEPASGSVGIEWLGHGAFRFVSCSGKVILIDPWIESNPKCPSAYRGTKGFDRVDIIVWTHGHVDHFMLSDAKRLIEAFDPLVVAPWELGFFIKGQIPVAKVQLFQLGNKGATADFSGIKLTMVEAFHSAGAQLTGFEGENHYVGEAVGYIIEFENGRKLYHAGDTSLMGDMKTIIGEFYKPDAAILPIGGVFTMGPEEAAYACKLIGAKIVIPAHYGTFPVLEQTPDRFVQRVASEAPKTEVRVAEIGKMMNL
jgi:L-ascorbate metabolism protein UlaG (beta-lactamase superfamily)